MHRRIGRSRVRYVSIMVRNGKRYTRWWIFLLQSSRMSVVQVMEGPAPALGLAFPCNSVYGQDGISAGLGHTSSPKEDVDTSASN